MQFALHNIGWSRTLHFKEKNNFTKLWNTGTWTDEYNIYISEEFILYQYNVLYILLQPLWKLLVDMVRYLKTLYIIIIWYQHLYQTIKSYNMYIFVQGLYKATCSICMFEKLTLHFIFNIILITFTISPCTLLYCTFRNQKNLYPPLILDTCKFIYKNLWNNFCKSQ